METGQETVQGMICGIETKAAVEWKDKTSGDIYEKVYASKSLTAHVASKADDF